MDKTLEKGEGIILRAQREFGSRGKSEFVICKLARSHTISCAHSDPSEIEPILLSYTKNSSYCVEILLSCLKKFVLDKTIPNLTASS
jgi:hypothetical protein